MNEPLSIPILIVLASLGAFILWRWILLMHKLAKDIFVAVCVNQNASPEVQAEQKKEAEKAFDAAIATQPFVGYRMPLSYF